MTSINFNSSEPLFIFEMANNHMGNLDQGLQIIRDIHKVCKEYPYKFGFKLQYRNLDTFIHPDFVNRMDLKYIKRFSETRLTEDQFKKLKDEMVRFGFITVCTPFDESSVDLIEKHNFDIIKIASCSFTDWPLLDRIVEADKPIVASTAGTALDDIDKVVSFFEHRDKKFALMHCVAIYPTLENQLQLNQIDLFKQRYPTVKVGYSTHERPSNIDSIKIAIAKGATIFEKHVGVQNTASPLNDYSATPEQIRLWLDAARKTFDMCGVHGVRSSFSEEEINSLKSLRRGVFAKTILHKNIKIGMANVFFAMPNSEEQLTANDMSKYTTLVANSEIDAKAPLLLSNTTKLEQRDKIYAIVKKVKAFLNETHVVVPPHVDLEISHHYGVEQFENYGLTMMTVVNRDYCKKLIVLLPNQKHPEQYHKQKEETFHILHGKVSISLDGNEKEYNKGDVVIVERGMKHSFKTNTGVVIEEISSTHWVNDSFYTDPRIAENEDRKTLLTYWLE
jgi:sialic acid synthase SpsE/mannose-6-phosphate isomerase-like protein (cupin superfamily)